MKFLEPDSQFYAKADFTLSSTDEEVLSLLYGPLIKAPAMALYHILLSYSLLQKGYEDNALFSQSFGLNGNDFLSAREHLEAVGLLETFREENGKNDGVHYLYHLLPPATPKKFFDDVLLKTALKSILGDKEWMKRKSYFHINGQQIGKGYQDVSVSFKDVFTIDLSNETELIRDVESGNALEKQYKSQARFSLAKVKKILKSDHIPFPKEEGVSEKILSDAVLYGLTEEECAEFIEKNTTTDNLFSYEAFLSDVKAAKRFQTKRSDKETNDYVTLGKTGKILSVFASLTPREYLAAKLGAEPPEYMLSEIRKIKKDIGLNDSVINVVFDYSFRKLKGEFNSNYIEKVCYSLSASNIVSANDAMVYLNERDYQIVQASNKKTRRRKNTTKAEESQDESNDEGSDISLADIQEELDL